MAAIVKDLRSADPNVYASGVDALLKVHSADAIPILKSIVSDQNPDVRRAALLAVARLLPSSDAAIVAVIKRQCEDWIYKDPRR
jgi:HEAT repeat protein